MNKIILTFQGGVQTIVPIQEDFQIETVTEFTSFADLCPTIDSLTTLGIGLEGTSGSISPSGLGIRSLIDAPRWSKTLPIKILADLFFYTQDNAQYNVVDEVNWLLGLHLLTMSVDGKRILIPGINAKNVSNISDQITKITENKKATKADKAQLKVLRDKEKKEKDLKNITAEGSLFSVLIPGVIFIKDAFIAGIEPTYSKHVTDQGFPLWANVRLQIQSLSPGFAEFFFEGVRLAQATTDKIQTESI
jgi:hypothetical protein